MTAGTRRGLLLAIAVAIVSVPACSSGSSSAPEPRVVKPTSLGGSSGVGPLVVEPTATGPGASSEPQPVVLPDRVVTISRVSSQPGANERFRVIAIDVEIQAAGDHAILNQSSFFRLVGAGGDFFAPRTDGSDPFYEEIDARGSRAGSINFEIPKGAASGLSLFYRPEEPADAVIIPLEIG